MAEGIELKSQEICDRSVQNYILALKEGQSPSTIKEVSKQIREIGRQNIQDIFGPISRTGGVAFPVGDYLQGRPFRDIARFVAGWSLIAAGSLTEQLEETFRSGWRFADFISLINLSTSGTPIPSIRPEDILQRIPETDRHLAADGVQTHLITRVLVEQSRLIREGQSELKTPFGYFFQTSNNFAQLIPVRAIVGGIVDSSYLSTILASGQSIDHLTGIVNERTSAERQHITYAKKTEST